MQPYKSKLACVIGALFLGASGASNAATGTFDITVTTLADVVLAQKQALSFGANLFTTAAGTCQMDATTPPSDTALMQYEEDGTAVAGATFGDLSGTGCIVGATATPGVYRISGTANSTVNITIGSLAPGGDFSFTPNTGCIVAYVNSSEDGTGSDDTCTTFTADSATPRRLPTATEEQTTGPVGVTVAGELVFSVGGTVTVGATPLTASTAYTANFPVTVVY
jgi:hypothetical protein